MKKVISLSKGYVFQKGTYHVYKQGKTKLSLSNLTDRLRKFLPKNSIIFITKEKTLDGFPHFHYLVGYPKFTKPKPEFRDSDDPISILDFRNEPSFLPTLKGYKLWYETFTRKKDMSEYLLYMCKYFSSPTIYFDYNLIIK